jgi:hypothetical protein
MIDMSQIAAHVRELEQAAAEPPPQPSASTQTFNWTLRIGNGNGVQVFRSSSSSREAADIDRMFAEAMAEMSAEDGSKSLVKAGLGVVIRWLGKKID